METPIKKEYLPYGIMLCIFFMVVVFSFMQQKPVDIFWGLLQINTSRSVLITDYIKIGGTGAAFLNAVMVGMITMFLLIKQKIVPTGSTIMAMFLTFGFAMFGKNILNMLPITFGVFLYAKTVKKPYSDFYMASLLAATISPITSEIIFLNILPFPFNFLLGFFVGTLSGFLFPMLSEFVSRVHGGYNLYNMGFVGGLLATFFIAFLTSMGIDAAPEFHVSEGNNIALGNLLYSIAFFLILCGFLFGNKKRLFVDMKSLLQSSGKLPSDYYSLYGENIYINMGMLCAFSTTLMLFLGAQLNGPVLAGILTITGFGAVGKHMKNTAPLIVGAILAAQINRWDIVDPKNILTILFCTGLSPIAGQYGVSWGVFAGFLHVCIVHHLGYLSSGLNLYSNGYAAGFVALMLIPIIEGVQKIKEANSPTILANMSLETKK